MNPDRPSAPDIDMDYADDRRDEMVEYARQKYGRDKVAQIGTFGTMAARGSVRDVTRALGYPVSMGDRIAKMIPMGKQGFPMTIELALQQVPELKAAYDTESDVKKIIDMAQKIEGAARHISIHAAGVVISPTDITDYTPLQLDPKGENKVITQYDMYSIEDAGLLKFDFLGLKNLSIIADTLALVLERHGIDIDLDNLDLNDVKTYELLRRGDTEDLFQLNGDGMTRFLKELKPNNIHDINAMVALYRPGPLQFIPDYIARKHDPSKIPEMDPAIYDILKSTFGVLVYQDDLLMMAHKLAGYNWGEVDKFRKAVGKKIPEEMAAQKEKFFSGIVKNGQTLQFAEDLWKLFLQQNKKCALSGIELTFSKIRKDTTGKTISLDRIDSSKGYVPGNVQFVHKHINIMKNKFDQDYFISLCKSIINHDQTELTAKNLGKIEENVCGVP